MATCSQKTAPSKVFLDIPGILFVPRPDAVVVVHFPEMKLAQKALVDARAHQVEVLAKASLKTDTGADVRLLDGLADFLGILVAQTNRLLNDQVFSSFGGRNGLLRMLGMWRANIHDLNLR